jgi:hypothetical protein
LLALSSPLFARSPGQAGVEPSSEQARKDVVTALSVGNPGHAEEIVDRAFRADPDASFLYQLGLIAQAQKRTVAALDLYRRYQELAGPAVSAETNAAIETFAAGQTAPVTVLNVIAPPGLLLCMDDRIVGMLPEGSDHLRPLRTSAMTPKW